MSAERPKNVDEMITWLSAHPGEPFLTMWGKDRLIVGTRNDDGALFAWDCTVNDERCAQAPRSPEGGR